MAHTMALVTKSGKKERLLKDSERALIDDLAHPKLQALLASIYDQDLHVACDCRLERPVSHICYQQASNHYYWRINQSSEAGHADGCSLGQESRQLSVKAIKKPLEPLPLVGPLNLYPTPDEQQCAEKEPKSKSGKQGSGLRRNSPLSRLLLNIIFNCQWDRYPCENYNYRRVIRAMSEVELVHGISAESLFTCRYDYLQSKGKQLAHKHWPEGQEPYLLAFHRAKSVNLKERRMVLFDKDQDGQSIVLNLEARLINIAGGFGDVPGPFIAIVSYRLDQNQELVPYQSACMPVVSRDVWMPVDSNNERSVFGHLQVTWKAVSNKLDHADVNDLEIFKPLRSVLPDGEDPLIPDFIVGLKNKSRQCAVEVNGLCDQEYLNHKARQLDREKAFYGESIALDMTKNTREAVTHRIKKQHKMMYWLASLDH